MVHDIADSFRIMLHYWWYSLPVFLLIFFVFVLPLCYALVRAHRAAIVEDVRATPDGPRVFYAAVLWRKLLRLLPLWTMVLLAFGGLGYWINFAVPLVLWGPETSHKYPIQFVEANGPLRDLTLPLTVFFPLLIVSLMILLASIGVFFAERMTQPVRAIWLALLSTAILFAGASIPCWFSARGLYMQFGAPSLWGDLPFFGLSYPQRLFVFSLLIALCARYLNRRASHRNAAT